ncbi:Flavin-dependent oxidoreductase, luciferase family (includes alkanesulfonate monooxygenase SsuD and methylene tetrahydromethanopterin reductase) [Enhydrobacter aerosaccus]|uniref:Flavin-dependent oxidoreductase, luciferase family (Includes alkanesulfonate monooxygenase SsuD and methylene tetrahydromethanopterin reductase) n=1 Tax=Enhydrobacter aerosaccus TaxID=225324 RepID=A0A1T4LBF6_9HYPH|nr:LLM class flavin-dependent oxidoreductase [Enhydrobacter aerosaccus]SJZ52010.1 Flavin-dependent oxidoreductase, luciferase family (includes alkanesulfonate monooxygenase SsuD and methylene tetrahydromethanopterin reductase) [Enhydrobacter aerosaccus]
MKFGVFDHMDRAGPDIGRQFEERLRLIELYEKSGFHAYHLAEHHATPLGMAPSPSVFLAAVAQRTRTLRFGPLVYTLNLYHPLRLIDEICMLDQMSGGRLELGVGRGISPYEVGYFGIDPATGPERFAEALDVIVAGLSQPRLTYKGKYFVFDDVPMEMQPVQRPHPPLWYGANSLESADRLAKQACNTVVGMKAEAVGQFAARYRAAWQALGRHETDMPLIGLSRHVVVADTDREAQSTAKRAFALWYDALIHLWRAHGVGLPRQMIPAEFESALDGGYIVAGSASTVRDRLRKDNAIAGINYCLCRLAFGDLSFEESARSVELMAREVMPALA